jgi:two-component system, NtrC family, sensor histidine kinase HydH
METFTLGAISLTIAISLLIRRKSSPLYVWFSALCLALFLMEIGSFFFDIFAVPFWAAVHFLGALAIPPFCVAFSRYFLNNRPFLPKMAILLTSIGSVIILASFLLPVSQWFSYLPLVPSSYIGCILVYFLGVLLYSMKHKVPEADRTRTRYVLIACIVAAALSLSDLLAFFGYNFPRLSAMAVSALLYFILIVITHSELPEMYEIMARALLMFIIVLFTALAFVIVVGLFWRGELPPLSTILVASLIIVIANEPFKMVLKKLFDYFFPDNKGVFASLYAFDKELEREKSMLLEEMATGLAHEIRNPLGSIKGAAQYLKGDANAENQKMLNVIIEEVDRLNGAVSKFLDYARPYTLNLKPQPLDPLIQKAISLIQANHASENVMIESELAHDMPLVNIDAEQMIQVILNISINAIQAMPEGGVLSFRTARVENAEGGAVALSIRDTGQGIGPEEMKNIFKPFFTTKKRGVGLGLALCQRIVRKHGGRIRVKSIPGQGSIFYIRLPSAV